MSTEAAARAGAILEIDLAAVVENWRLLAARAMPAQCAAVVKADAYGLGAAPVAGGLMAAGCRLFFVATLDEGIAVRGALGGGPEIAVLNGPFPGTAGEFIEHRLIPVLNEPAQIAEWMTGIASWPGLSRPSTKEGVDPRAKPGDDAPAGAALARKPSVPVEASAVLHVDTGMARLGLTAKEFDPLVDDPPPVRWRAVISHLACADDPDHPLNEQQRRRFAAAAAQLPGIPASLAASSGIFLAPGYHFDLVRPGAALYGINPQPGRPNPLCQVVRLCAKILQVREIDRGESVGYGAAHVMAAPGRVATVAVGYADGWLRSLSQRGSGRIGRDRVPLLGRVSMDLLTFDVSAVDPALARPGGTIELLGADHGVDDVAAEAGTIGYEILTALGRRYHRIYRGPDRPNSAGKPSE